jgi:hypothetical protein
VFSASARGYSDSTKRDDRLETLAQLVSQMHKLVTAPGVLESERPNSSIGVNSDVLGKIASRAEDTSFTVCIYLTLGKITAA